jgi:hypothetical protein
MAIKKVGKLYKHSSSKTINPEIFSKILFFSKYDHLIIFLMDHSVLNVEITEIQRVARTRKNSRNEKLNSRN